MTYQLQLRPYQRPFRQPLRTHHGIWAVREGFLVGLQDEQGRQGWGEVAPLPDFGSETWAEAWEFSQSWGSCLPAGAIAQIPDHLPACQFAFESAQWAMQSPELAPDSALVNSPLEICGLLPTGAAALTAWPNLWAAGYRTLKWKIGVTDWEQELTWLRQLAQALPATAKLRLDANGGLTVAIAHRYLDLCDQLPVLEYVEQPLPPTDLLPACQLAAAHSTPLALDEAVNPLPQLQACYDQGWRGIVVLKPAIAGFPSRLIRFCQEHHLDVVVSSVFETEVGQQAVRAIAHQLQPQRATGLGVGHWFAKPEADPLDQTK